MKNKFLFLILLSLLPEFSIAQTDSSNLYLPPTFPKGTRELEKYAFKYIKYPAFAVEQGLTGVVEATMYINKEGRVKLVKAKGKIPEFNAEVKRILKLSPDWNPALKNGIPIDTMITQMVYFSLGNENPKITDDYIVIMLTWKPMIDSDIWNRKNEAREHKQKMILANKLNEEGSALMQLKKFGDALEKYNAAIEQGGELNLFLYNRGLAYLNLKQDDKARVDFLEAYRQGDEDAGKIYNGLFK